MSEKEKAEQQQHENEPCQDPNCIVHNRAAREQLAASVETLLQAASKQASVKKRSQQLSHVLATVIGMQRLDGETDHQALMEALCQQLAVTWVRYALEYVRLDGVYTQVEFERATAELTERLQAMLVEQSKQTTAALLLAVNVDRDARKAKTEKQAAQDNAERN